ncbi:MAG: hypothetical protein EOL89_08915 [Actinobacteria bacterium]|nr:hypothetical protein [Actinomycetota bacterium]
MKPVRWGVALLIVVAVVATVALAFGGDDVDALTTSPTAGTTVTQPTAEPTVTAATAVATEVPGMLTIARTADPAGLPTSCGSSCRVTVSFSAV